MKTKSVGLIFVLVSLMNFVAQPNLSIAQTQEKIKDRESLNKEISRRAGAAGDYKIPMEVEDTEIITKGDYIRRMDRVMSQIRLEYKNVIIDNSAYHEKFKSKSCALLREIPIGYPVNGVLNGAFSLWECPGYYATVEIFREKKGGANKSGVVEEAQNDIINGYKASTRYYVSKDGRSKSVYVWKDVEKMVEFTVYEDGGGSKESLSRYHLNNKIKGIDNRNRDMAALLE